MKVCVLLLCVCILCWRTEAQSRSFLITAPQSLRLDALETVLVQLFGFTGEVTVHVFLKTSMAPDHVLLDRQVLTLNPQNQYQAAAKVRLYPDRLDKSKKNVVLHVQSAGLNQHVVVPVSRTNGFLFIQTDKPLYTPHQNVKVRAFSLNQELRPANRSVFLKFRDPDAAIVDIVEMTDLNHGIPSMENPFKIPINPKLGIWTIEASYSDDFTTIAKTDFGVKEYVLPSFTIQVEPEENYLTYGQFQKFTFKVSARYLHGAPVAHGEVFLRYGYVSRNKPPVIIPNSVTRERLSSKGEKDVSVNMEMILSKHDGLKDLNSLHGMYLYIAILLEEDTGGISQDMEFAAVKFVKSPYTMTLVSTPPFIKPGLPYSIQVLVKDHLDEPVSRIPVHLVEWRHFVRGRESTDRLCSSTNVDTGSDGIALFACNIPSETTKADLKFQTANPSLPAASQAILPLHSEAYHSANQRYLYIDPPQPGYGLVVGQYAQISVYSATPSYVPIKALSYMVLSRGNVVEFGNIKAAQSDNRQIINFEVTSSMVPSIRLVVYYILYGEQTSELVADSVWLDVKAKCVSGLQTHFSSHRNTFKPQEKIQLDIRANQDGYVALSAVDPALFTLRPNYRNPVNRVLRHIEHSDQGCGGGGGKDSADVFRLAGLTFITNANAQASSSVQPCEALVRPKRATEEEKKKKALTYGSLKGCCENGMMYSPKSVTCDQFATQTYSAYPYCRQAFKECCEFIQQDLDDDLVLARHEMGADFDQAPTLVRSYFPESWLWEVQPIRSGSLSLSRTLPDSLTTWEITGIGMFRNGICVADPVKVSVNMPISVDIPLPYQVVRGEQLELKGSVYNQGIDRINYCVTLTAGPAICLLKSEEAVGAPGQRSTTCTEITLPAGGVGKVSFTLLGLEPGEHTLTFTLKTRHGLRDIVEKKLRVVPEGLRTEEYSGGRLDPQGIYGIEKMEVLLKNKLPTNVVPNTAVERLLTINGEILGEVLNLVHKPEGLRQLVNLPSGSAEAELGGVLPLIHVYRYLETTASWDALGDDIQKNAAKVKQMIKEGLVSISSFRHGDSGYSMWMKQKPSTWLTALVVKTLALVDQVFPVSHGPLSNSVDWLIRNAQQPDGSFNDSSSYRPNKIMAAGADAVDRSVYLTSFVLIALTRATSIQDPILQLRSHEDSKRSAANYLTQHARNVKSVYVRAVATYALTLHDPNSMIASEMLTSLERLARQKGNPAILRYWQESNVAADWLKPDQSSGLTVEMTAYVLLTVLLKGRIPYANPILSWLSQDQHYGEGFYSIQDTVLTLEGLTEYSKIVPRAVLNQEINIRYSRKGAIARAELSRSRPVARPMEVTKNDDIIVSTGYGRGVSNVKLKTVYFQTTSSTQNCNFDITVEITGRDMSRVPSMRSPHLVTCVKYKPPPNEVYTESSMTVMKIELPTGVEAQLEDLRQFRDGDRPFISHYELQGNTVVIQMDTVPSDVFLCLGFRVKSRFTVHGASESVLSLYEAQDKGSMCTKQFSYAEQRLQRLCVGAECQCMTAACAIFRGTPDLTLTVTKRLDETCKPHIRYAFRVNVVSSAAEGDFMTYTANVVEVLKNTDKEFEAITSATEVELVKKATCTAVDIQNGQTYLLLGASGSEFTVGRNFRYRLPVDSEAIVELWPKSCTPDCNDYVNTLADYALELQLASCPDAK